MVLDKAPLIRLHGVGKVYRSREVEYIAIKEVSLDIMQGEFVTILGPSGSGKTTLLDLIGTLDTPTKGKIYIESIDISKFDDKKLSELRNEKIGFIFQSYNLIPYLSVIENVMLPLTVSSKNDESSVDYAMELLKEVGLAGKVEKKPSELSGGEQQRVAIVRALINKPQILLADEPTGNLDTKTSDEVLNMLVKVSKERGTTIVMVTHDPELTVHADRCIYMRDGIIEREKRVRK